MSVEILCAFQQALEAVGGDMLPIVTESDDDVEGQHQKVHLHLAEPDNLTYGDDFSEVGTYQVTLVYLANEGPGAAYSQAKRIQAAFYRGLSLMSGHIVIQRTPAIGPGARMDDKYYLAVKIRFFTK